MESKILNEFKKKMKMEARSDLFITMDMGDYGEWLQTCTIMEATPNGKTWDIVCYKTGKIKNIYEM